MNMKKILYMLFAGVLLLVSSCQKPQFIEPTAERQGITSITAYFTDGPFIEQELAKLVVDDPDLDRYVIPVPWFFPEESDNQTIVDMARVRVRAELAKDCKIDPPLTIMDLYQEYEFTFTEANGKSRKITITGERVKSSTATALSFNLLAADESVVVEGFIDNEAMEIYLFTVEDLNGLTAVAEPWYHATIKNEKALAEPRNWNEEQSLTIIAHDGKTEGTYKIIKRNPEKIDYGFNVTSLKELFNIDPVSRIGVPSYELEVFPSLAYLGGNLVIGHGPEYDPVYVDGRNGSKLGTIATGGKKFGALTSDEGGNLILCNRLTERGTFEIYKTKSVTEAPALFHSYESDVALPLGSKIKVCGDINKDARITVSYEGVSGVTSSSQFLEITVVDGTVVSEVVHDLTATGISWGNSPVNSAGLVPASSEAGKNGWYFGQYDSPVDGMYWLKPDYSVGQHLNGSAWDTNPAWLESKQFNGANYLALLVGAHFPGWGGQPSIYLYDISDPTSVSGTYQEASGLVISSPIASFNGNNAAGNATQSAGDVLIAPSADGFKVFVYYYDHYAGAIGGYSADCVKK